MKHERFGWVIVVCLSLLLISVTAFAKGKGKGHSGDRPFGWDQGEKKGWQSDVPPAMEKADDSHTPGLSKDKEDEDIVPQQETEEVLEEGAREERKEQGKGLRERSKDRKRHEKREKRVDD